MQKIKRCKQCGKGYFKGNHHTCSEGMIPMSTFQAIEISKVLNEMTKGLSYYQKKLKLAKIRVEYGITKKEMMYVFQKAKDFSKDNQH